MGAADMAMIGSSGVQSFCNGEIYSKFTDSDN
jgi:hypothetical protein